MTASAVLLLPSQVDHREHLPPPPPPVPQVDPQQEARRRAYELIGKELEVRMDLHMDERDRLAVAIVDESLKHRFDPLFILAVIEAESNFDMEAVSPTGARGLMQLLPSTIKEQARIHKVERLRMFDPVHNVTLGIAYMSFLGKSFRHPDRMLLAYNQGPGGALAILRDGMPPTEEAANYVPKIWSKYRAFLKRHGLDDKQMKKLCRSPEATIVRI